MPHKHQDPDDRVLVHERQQMLPKRLPMRSGHHGHVFRRNQQVWRVVRCEKRSKQLRCIQALQHRRHGKTRILMIQQAPEEE